MNASAEKFMTPAGSKPEALRWLQNAPRDNAMPWIRALRATGAEAFAATGLPTAAWEGWQHANLRALSQTHFRYSSAPVTFDTAKLPQPLLQGAARIVVVNGQFQPHLSAVPRGVTVLGLMEAAEKDIGGQLEEWLVNPGNFSAAPFKALGAAHLRDGFVLAAEGDIAQPVEVLFCNIGDAASPPAFYPRLLYRLGRNAGLTVLERHCGEGDYFSNLVSTVVLEPDSRLKFHRLMEESQTAQHLSHMEIRQQKNASFEGFSLASGAAFAREEYHAILTDSVISTGIKGVYVLKGKQNHDFTVSVTHCEPEGRSEQYFKGVADDEARAIFQGSIHVRRSAQKTNGYQSHHALLLSRQAEACFKPELEIYADDVKCSHGATSGHLDPMALFYLQSRGIPEKDARALLVASFLAEAVDHVTDAAIRDIYRQRITDWLEERKT